MSQLTMIQYAQCEGSVIAKSRQDILVLSRVYSTWHCAMGVAALLIWDKISSHAANDHL